MDDKALHLLAGSLYIGTTLLFAPIYARIVYIFITQSFFNKVECYRIMIQIGIVQLVTAPTALTSGISQLRRDDMWSITSFPLKLFWVTTRVEYLLSFVLALNRVKVMCGLKCPPTVNKILFFAIYSYGLVLLIALHSPYCDLVYHVDHFISVYDLSKPYSYLLAQTSAILSMTAMCASLLCYVIVATYLLLMRTRTGEVKNLKAERSILIYAFVRFVCDMFIVVTYNYFKFPPINWIGLPIVMTFALNNLVIPVVLYIGLYKNIREQFFKISLVSIVHVPSSNQTY
uniref:Serpentine receptor class gamma n=1 Tax=Steinernema glaseri TaxID=37863 RepID=A0A1I8AGV4_9BILA